MYDLDPKVKVIGKKVGICDGVPSTAALVAYVKMSLINAHVGLFSASRCLNFGLGLYLHPYFVLRAPKAMSSLGLWADLPEPLLLADDLVHWPIKL